MVTKPFISVLTLLILCSTGEAQTIVTSSDGASIVLSARVGTVERRVDKLTIEVKDLHDQLELVRKSVESRISHPAIVEPTEATTSTETPTTPVQDKVESKSPFYLTVFSEPWCSACVSWENTHANDLRRARFEMVKCKSRGNRTDGTAYVKSSLPAFELVDASTNLVVESWSGGISYAEIMTKVNKHRSKSKIKTKVKTDPVITNSSSYGDSTSSRYYYYGGRTYDLESYGGCSMRNCGMCAEIRSAQQAYRASKRLINSTGPQAPTPQDVMTEALGLLNLTPDSKPVELGSGDGRVLIEMVKRYGVKYAEGIELDPEQVALSRKLIDEAGLSDRITIIEGDVREKFNPYKYDRAYAYLYPEVLTEISDNLKKIPVVVCPGHKPEGIQMDLVGQCWINSNPTL